MQKELYESVKPYLIISEIFVCAPITSHRYRPYSSLTARRLAAWLHWLWCFCVYLTLTISAYAEYTESNIDLPTIQKPLYFSEYLVYLIHIGQIIVGTFYGRHKFREFLRFVVEFDCRLTEFGVRANYKLVKIFLRQHLLLILLHFVVTAIIGYFYTGQNWGSFARSTTVYTLPNTILHICLGQYYGLLYAIAVRAVQLNKVLSTLLAPSYDNPCATLSQRLQLKLGRLRVLYAHLEAFTKQVNDAFALSIVLVYVGSFMNISVNIFLIYKYLANPNGADLSWIFYSVDWTVMHIGKMFLILYYNHCVQNQKESAADILTEFNGHNTKMEETVSHFIFQLIIDTRSNNASGLAVLNLEFITSLLVAISTLFIFLLQYDITFEALTKTYNSARPKYS